MGRLLAQADAIQKGVEGIANSELARQVPAFVVTLILLFIFLGFLLLWDKRQRDMIRETNMRHAEMQEKCHETHKETTERLAVVVDKNTAAIGECSAVLGESRRAIDRFNSGK